MARNNLGEQAKRPIDRKSQPGGEDSLRNKPEGCVTGMARNNLGEQAKRPIDKKLMEQAKRPIDKKLMEQAKRPIDKKC
jgi:hypothetical protein